MKQDLIKQEQGLISLLIMGLIFILIAVGVYIYLNKNILIPQFNSASQTKTTPNPTPFYAKKEAQVIITKDGFSPQTITVDKGAEVTFINKDSQPHQVASDPHPTHTLLPAFVQDELLNINESTTFTFEKVGMFTYHDEVNPLKFKGTIIVK